MKKLLVIGVVLALAGFANAELLIGFDFNGYAGNELEGTSTVAAANMQSPSYISRGSGLTAAANADRFNAQGWDGYADADNALAGGNYFEFTIAPQASYYMSITQVTFLVQRSNTGASNFVLRASFNSYASDIGTPLLDWAGNSVTVGWTNDVSGVAGLQNVNGAITFRVIGWTGSSTGSSGFEGTGNDIEVYGSVAAIPEPATLLLMGLGGVCIAAGRQRFRA